MSRDARLDRFEDKLDTALEVVTRLSAQFDGVPSRVRALEDKALQFESGRRAIFWLITTMCAVGSTIGAIIGWVLSTYQAARSILNG